MRIKKDVLLRTSEVRREALPLADPTSFIPTE